MARNLRTDEERNADEVDDLELSRLTKTSLTKEIGHTVPSTTPVSSMTGT